MSVKQELCNDIVRMRKVVRQCRVHVVHKLTKEIKTLRDRKGSDEQKEKNQKKADRLAQEILSLKGMKDDAISKHVLTETKKPNQILSDIKSNHHDRVLAKIMAHQTMEKHVKTMLEKYPAIREMLDKPPKPRKKKVKKPKKKVTADEEDKWVVESTSEAIETSKIQKQFQENGDESSSDEVEPKQKVPKILKKPKRIEEKDNGLTSNRIAALKKLKNPKLIEEKENASDDIEIKQKTPLKKKAVQGKEKRSIVSKMPEVKPLLEVVQPISPSKKTPLEKKGVQGKEKRSTVSKISEVKPLLEVIQPISPSKKIPLEKKGVQGKEKKSIVSKISEVKPLLEVIKPISPTKIVQKIKDRVKPNKSVKPINMSFGTDDEVTDGEDVEVSGQTDSFFLTGDNEDKFLNINIKTDDSSDKEPQVNKIYNDNLNRKQRRTLAKGGKITKPKSFNNFNNKNAFNSLSFMKSDQKSGSKIAKEPEIVKEVLHPSWQAKKLLKPQIAQFEGKKIVFDD